jgi:hypothetical protein
LEGAVEKALVPVIFIGLFTAAYTESSLFDRIGGDDPLSGHFGQDLVSERQGFADMEIVLIAANGGYTNATTGRFYPLVAPGVAIDTITGKAINLP